MKLGHVIEYNVRNFFLKNHAQNEAGRLVSEEGYLYLFFKEALYKVKASGQHLNFNKLW